MRIELLFQLPIVAFAQISFSSMHPEPPPSFPLYSPTPYKAEWDLNMSPYAGGEDLLFATRALERAEIYFLSKSAIVYSSTAYARLWRLTELIAIWLPENYFTSVVQHEVFGHGYRIRDIGRNRARVAGYSFGVPPPYGYGGASTSYDIGENLTTTEEAAIAMGGVEATAILAQLTKLKWLQTRQIDPRQSLLYILSQQDLSLYIGTLTIKNEDISGHDIHGYLNALNTTYPDHILSKGRLRSLAWINLADPFTFYAAYSWFRYLASGKQTYVPMIASRYLFGFRLGLTPFGPEVFFENYVLHKKWPIYAYFKGGQHADNGYYGVGIYAPKVLDYGCWSFGVRADLWRQPKLLLQPASTSILDLNLSERPNPNDPLYPSSERHAVRIGAAGSLVAWYRETGIWGAEGELGYKSQGFLPGYSLRAFPTLRVAFTLVF